MVTAVVGGAIALLGSRMALSWQQRNAIADARVAMYGDMAMLLGLDIVSRGTWLDGERRRHGIPTGDEFTEIATKVTSEVLGKVQQSPDAKSSPISGTAALNVFELVLGEFSKYLKNEKEHLEWLESFAKVKLDAAASVHASRHNIEFRFQMLATPLIVHKTERVRRALSEFDDLTELAARKLERD